MVNEKLKQEYDEIKNKREDISKKIIKLRKDDKVQKYLSLVNEDKNLSLKEQETYETMKTQEYKFCLHLGVRTFIERDWIEGRVYEYLGCVKCGLDTSLLAKYNDDDLKYLSLEQRVMYQYLKNNPDDIINLDLPVDCNLELAQAIYSKIIGNNPGIDNMTALKYLEIALQNMQTKDTHESRRQSRVKRLNLNKNFNAF